ncbi:seed maturation-like protein [Wolffia australiana]
MAAASGRAAFLLSRFKDLSFKGFPSGGVQRLESRGGAERRQSSRPGWLCLASGVEGSGGLADDLVSTSREQRRRRREYSALANVLCRVEPLDASEIAVGVSMAAKEAMKRTISSMLGLLPSDRFRVAVCSSDLPLTRLLVSSVITGYTLWNAEYRLSLVRNFENSSPISGEDCEVKSVCSSDEGDGLRGIRSEEEVGSREKFEVPNIAALNFIQKLEAELVASEKELEEQLQEKKRMECMGKNDSDLLVYLRSLEQDMVTELSQPSSPEVEEIIHQLVRNIHMKCFGDAADSESSNNGEACVSQRFNFISNDKNVETLNTTRDYLAKLLFWCMLLGHHMRGLEYRLHLSFAVGLL